MSEVWRKHLKPEEETRLAEIEEMQAKARDSILEKRKIIDRARKRAEKAAREAVSG